MIERILEVLENSNKFLTINLIYDGLGFKREDNGEPKSKDKLHYIRLCVYRLSVDFKKDKDGNKIKITPIITKQGRRKKEHLYSLNDNVTSKYNPIHRTIIKKMIPPFRDNKIKVILEPIEIKEIQKLAGELDE